VKQNREISEPDELIFSLCKVEKQWSPSEEDMVALKEVYHTVSETLRAVLPLNGHQLIPVGSYVIGCVTKYSLVADCYLSLEKGESEITDGTSIALALKDKLDSQFADRADRGGASFTCEKSPADPKTLVITDSITKATVRLFTMTSDIFQSDSNITRASAAIFHSNWLINLYNQTQNAWQTIKLFRIIRIWK
jgi:hypothetical protein